MNPTDLIIVAIVVALFILAARRAVGTWTGERDCCSGAKKSNAKTFPHVHISDTDPSHYPYKADLTIKGMSCDNCVRHVTDALDSVDGTWAQVDLPSNTAHVLSKNPIDTKAYRKVVSQAGYSVA